MPHRHNEEAEEHLDVYHKVHNHGWIALVDYMGNDTRIAEAARQSTSGKSKGEEKDRELLMYMFENHHTSPFEMVETVWHVRMPIFVMRQWVRHRTSSLNEYSGRYSKMKPEFYVPELTRAIESAQDESNHQGSQGGMKWGAATWLCKSLVENQAKDWRCYESYLDTGFSRELSRINLPLSTYTTIMWKMDLHNLFHFLALRMHPHAQYEIRAYADIMWRVVKDIAPIACEAFEQWVLKARTLSMTQVAAMKEVNSFITGLHTGGILSEDSKELDELIELIKRTKL